MAIAYQSGTSFQRKTNQDQRYVNLCTAIYECESTGKVLIKFFFREIRILKEMLFFFRENRWIRMDQRRCYSFEKY